MMLSFAQFVNMMLPAIAPPEVHNDVRAALFPPPIGDTPQDGTPKGPMMTQEGGENGWGGYSQEELGQGVPGQYPSPTYGEGHSVQPVPNVLTPPPALDAYEWPWSQDMIAKDANPMPPVQSTPAPPTPEIPIWGNAPDMGSSGPGMPEGGLYYPSWGEINSTTQA